MNLDRRLLAEASGVRLYLLLAVGAGFLGAIAVVLQARFLSRAIAAVFLDGAGLSDLSASLTILLAAICARAALRWARDLLASHAAARIRSELRARLLATLLSRGPLYASGERTGELANTVVEGVESLDAYYSQYLPSLALAGLVPLTILAFVFPIDLLSGFVFLLTAPLIPLFMVLIGKMAEVLTRRQWESLSWMSSYFLDVLQGLTTLQLFNRSKPQVDTIARVTDRFRGTTLGVLRVAFLSALVLEITGSISTAIVAVEVGLRLLYSSIGFEQAFFILVLAPEFYLPLRTLGASFHAGMSGAAAARRIYEVLDSRDGATGGQGDRENTPRLASSPDLLAAPPRIELRNVSLSYESGERLALKGVTFALEAGQSVALVGPSGAGKSSIAALLMRFVEPEGGEIIVDGVPLREKPADEWRERVAWVPQTPHLFDGTILENIRLGRPGATADEVGRAAAMAGVDEFVKGLPDGYETRVGERGARLSGGQAQRVALARALLKDAPVLVLDEPTSGLDPETEAGVQETMARLMRGRTVLVIAHRLNTVRGADRVVVLDRGRVAETGAHSRLLEQCGLYAGMVAAHGWVPEGQQLSALSYESSVISPEPRVLSPFPSTQDSALSTSPSPQSSSAAVVRWLLGLIAPFGWWMALAALLGFATVGAGVGLISTAAFLIASAALHPSVADLAIPIVGVRFFGISRGVFRYLERYASHDVTFRLLGRVRVWFYATIEPRASEMLLRHRSSDLLSRMVADVESLQHFYVRIIAPPLVAVMVAASMWLFVGQFDTGLAALVLGFLLIGGFVVPLVVHRLSAGPSAAAAQIRARMNVAVVDGIQGMPDMLAFGIGRRWLEDVAAIGRNWMRVQQRLARTSGLDGSLNLLLAGSGSLAVLVAAVPLVRSGRLEGVLLPVLVLATLACFEAVAPLPLAFQHLGGAIEAGRRLLEVGNRAKETTQDSILRTQNLPPDPERRFQAPVVAIRNLRFRYGKGEPWILDGICLDLAAGKRVAMVGPSGSGKSTLASLLVRFWEHEEGSINLAGRDIRGWAPEEVREMVALVPQRSYLFSATVRENLLVARPDATEAQLNRAAEEARMHAFIQQLPRGYESWVGEQGVRLSGGERQRLAVARALLRDAPVLILDEPTANLDALTERDVFESIWTASENRALLLITHRLSALEAVDEVVVLRGGRIVERGSHSALIKAGGLYRRMWDLQQQLLPA